MIYLRGCLRNLKALHLKIIKNNFFKKIFFNAFYYLPAYPGVLIEE